MGVRRPVLAGAPRAQTSQTPCVVETGDPSRRGRLIDWRSAAVLLPQGVNADDLVVHLAQKLRQVTVGRFVFFGTGYELGAFNRDPRCFQKPQNPGQLRPRHGSLLP
jgi:hypothetical protein